MRKGTTRQWITITKKSVTKINRKTSFIYTHCFRSDLPSLLPSPNNIPYSHHDAISPSRSITICASLSLSLSLSLSHIHTHTHTSTLSHLPGVPLYILLYNYLCKSLSLSLSLTHTHTHTFFFKSTSPVKIGLTVWSLVDINWNIIIDNDSHLLYINASSTKIGCDEHLFFTLTKPESKSLSRYRNIPVCLYLSISPPA